MAPRPSRKEIARHLEGVFAAVPKGVEKVYARADSDSLRGSRGGVLNVFVGELPCVYQRPEQFM